MEYMRLHWPYFNQQISMPSVLDQSFADFRPAYLQLGSLKAAFPDVPTIAVTATATENVRRGIIGAHWSV